jgi:hypothetical protein
MWLTAALPASAALLNGRRLVMTEVSDFDQKMATGKPAALPAMQATAAWQAALGVTEYTLYYDTIWRLCCGQLPVEQIRDLGRPYTDYVGRLNALLRDARPVHHVLLYYPIADLWPEYKPVAGPLNLESQSPHARQIVKSFNQLGRQMLTQQISFLLVDRELLAKAGVRNGKLKIGGREYAALVVPAGVQLSELPVAVKGLADKGGLVLQDSSGDRPMDLSRLAALYPTGLIEPACADIVVGRFERAGRQILLLVNTAGQSYTGSVRTGDVRSWWLADPATGKIEKTAVPQAGRLTLSLPAQSAVLLVGAT